MNSKKKNYLGFGFFLSLLLISLTLTSCNRFNSLRNLASGYAINSEVEFHDVLGELKNIDEIKDLERNINEDILDFKPSLSSDDMNKEEVNGILESGDSQEEKSLIGDKYLLYHEQFYEELKAKKELIGHMSNYVQRNPRSVAFRLKRRLNKANDFVERNLKFALPIEVNQADVQIQHLEEKIFAFITIMLSFDKAERDRFLKENKADLKKWAERRDAFYEQKRKAHKFVIKDSVNLEEMNELQGKIHQKILNSQFNPDDYHLIREDFMKEFKTLKNLMLTYFEQSHLYPKTFNYTDKVYIENTLKLIEEIIDDISSDSTSKEISSKEIELHFYSMNDHLDNYIYKIGGFWPWVFADSRVERKKVKRLKKKFWNQNIVRINEEISKNFGQYVKKLVELKENINKDINGLNIEHFWLWKAIYRKILVGKGSKNGDSGGDQKGRKLGLLHEVQKFESKVKKYPRLYDFWRRKGITQARRKIKKFGDTVKVAMVWVDKDIKNATIKDLSKMAEEIEFIIFRLQTWSERRQYMKDQEISKRAYLRNIFKNNTRLYTGLMRIGVRKFKNRLSEILINERKEMQNLMRVIRKYAIKEPITLEEREAANIQFKDLLKATGLGMVIVIPLVKPLTIPLYKKICAKLGEKPFPSGFYDKSRKRSSFEEREHHYNVFRKAF